MAMQAETMQSELNNQWENYNCSVTFKKIVRRVKTVLLSVINI